MNASKKVAEAYDEFFQSMFPEYATHIIGITLVAPDRIKNVERFNDFGHEWRRQLLRHSVNFIDAAVYGRKHWELGDKFDFQARDESRSKTCLVVPRHIHCAMDLRDGRHDRVESAWPSIARRIAKIAEGEGFKPEVYKALVTDFEGMKKYITKWSMYDADAIYTRGTL